jgi:hypothetical protein
MNNNKCRNILAAVSVSTLACISMFSVAAVSPQEAARLNGDLTPLGAEKAGNAGGTIPAWTGGYSKSVAGEEAGGRRGDPFKDEKPLYSITAANMTQYADKLTDGVSAMLKKYPDSYRLDVYPTHRTAIAPQWVYDNTAKNAINAKMDGYVPSGAYGGIPFPIPKTGLEVINNHLLNWRGSSWEVDVNQYQITASGAAVLTTDGQIRQTMPYYFEDGSADKFDGYFWNINLVNVGPPIRAGEMIVGRSHLDSDKSAAYVYLTGQRRVRKLPNACCDTPAPATAGLMSFDELSVFDGSTDTFNWKLVGKQEMLIPYNENRFLQYSDSDVISKQHLNPDAVRWELHRVWVVEATLADGKRHQAPRSRYYLDEDTWQAVLGDRWDANGQLWKTLWMLNFVMPDFPGTIQGTFGYYDLLSGEGYVGDMMNDKKRQRRPSKRWPTDLFTGQGLAAQGVR